MDMEQPVVVTLSLGWNRIKLSARVRHVEVDLSARRAVYSCKQKAEIVEKTKRLEPVEAVKRLRTMDGYEKLTAKQLRRWRNEAAKANSEAGRKRLSALVDAR